MAAYFDAEQSMDFRCGSNPENAMSRIAARYIADHPPVPVTYRAYSRDGFKQASDARYDLNLGEKFPYARLGQYGYAFAKMWSSQETSWNAAISCYGPVLLYVNGRLVYRSGVEEEVNAAIRKSVSIPLQAGWNSFVLAMCKTASGFGCLFGTARSKWSSPVFLSPFAERAGQAGWIYSELAEGDVMGDAGFPDADAAEAESPLSWFPRMDWSEEERSQGIGARLFGSSGEGAYGFGWTKVRCRSFGKGIYRLRLASDGPAEVWVSGEARLSLPERGAAEKEVELGYGEHDVLVRFETGQEDWGFKLDVLQDGQPCGFLLPVAVHGTGSPWLYLGPMKERSDVSPADLCTLDVWMKQGKDGVCWQAERPNTAIRPYLENVNFARWNYPLGVTLYGLLQVGRALRRPDLSEYVHAHIRACTRLYGYSLWDKRMYGFPAVNSQLADMDMLDDCGSFASAMLEAHAERPDEDSLSVAADVADFIMNRQERKEDGVFYRASPGYFMENTLWGDDLYMSIPFLIRYAKLTGEERYLDEAAAQFLLFREYLYMPELRMMSHVYDFKYNTATMVPWGRGNGWPLFTLSELLEALPERHARRGELLAFFNEFCAGLLEAQGERGLWHQVLTDPQSYEESSCTAMFVYAFSRGVRLGYLEDKERYAEAARRGWEGLTRYAIDQWGNVYGVCRGSRYAFTPDYYKHELSWALNDTHGIGIVLLAGYEYGALTEACRSGAGAFA